MNQQKIMLTMLRGVLSEGSQEEQCKVKECAAKIRAVVAEYGDEGKLANALVGAEFAAE